MESEFSTRVVASNPAGAHARVTNPIEESMLSDPVMSSAANKVVELKRLLAEKFPGVRMSPEAAPRLTQLWKTGIPPIDDFLGGGFPKSGMTEVVATGPSSGSATMTAALLRQTASAGQWLALIDAADCFDPTVFLDSELQRLLWVRCTGAREALKGADLVLHDGTVGLAVLDLGLCPPAELRKISSSTWFRLERLVEEVSTALVIISPQAIVSNASARMRLEPRFSLDALDRPHELLAEQLRPMALETSRRIVKIA